MVVYDSGAPGHACIIDGLRLHTGKRFVYPHNDMAACRKQLARATKLAEENGWRRASVITEGVFGMKGDLGKLDEIVAMKKDFNFRLLVDDAHGFGTMERGSGTPEHFGVTDGVDVLFNTFAKSMAGIGAFVSSEKFIVDYLRYNMRSQTYAKALPMPMVKGALRGFILSRTHPEFKENLWKIVRALQSGFRERGFDIGGTLSPVTPVYMKGGVDEACNIVVDLRNYNRFCSVVVYPVIPKGEIILRIIPTAVHTLDDVNYTLDCFEKCHKKLLAGEYKKPMPDMSEK